MSNYALGIDLGTSNSCVAVVELDKAVVIPDRTGNTLTPSVVAITEGGKRLIGSLAKRQAITNANHTVFASKRLIGRNFKDPEVQQAFGILPYELKEGPNETVSVILRGKPYALSEIAAMILSELRCVAEDFLGMDVQKAVITVPAYFDDAQRQATIDAGRIAGLDVLRIINEPTAAAIAYASKLKDRRRIAVYDLGGGTFDISILSVDDGVYDVRASTGDSFLGGEDFDNRIIEALVMDFARMHAVDLRDDPMAMQRLKVAAEKAKCDLSELEVCDIRLPFIHSSKEGQALHLETELTRTKLEELTVDLVKRTLKITQLALNEANVTVQDIDEVLLVGGMTRMPLIEAAVSKLFQQKATKNIHVDEAVALGAALHAHALLSGGVKHILLDVTPFDLGIAVQGGRFNVIVPKNTTIPSSQARIFTTASDNQSALRIVVLQGDASIAADQQVLAEFCFEDIEPAPAGSVDIEIRFDIDADGIVHVTARDLATKREHSVQVQRRSNLSPEEVQRMALDNASYLIRERDFEAREKRKEELAKFAKTFKRFFSSSQNRADSRVLQSLALIEEAQDALERGAALSDIDTRISLIASNLSSLA